MSQFDFCRGHVTDDAMDGSFYWFTSDSSVFSGRDLNIYPPGNLPPVLATILGSVMLFPRISGFPRSSAPLSCHVPRRPRGYDLALHDGG